MTLQCNNPTRSTHSRQEEVVCNDGPTGLQRQPSTFCIKIGVGNQLAVPGEAQCVMSKPRARPGGAVFCPWLPPALLKAEASSVMGLVSAEVWVMCRLSPCVSNTVLSLAQHSLPGFGWVVQRLCHQIIF